MCALNLFAFETQRYHCNSIRDIILLSEESNSYAIQLFDNTYENAESHRTNSNNCGETLHGIRYLLNIHSTLFLIL